MNQKIKVAIFDSQKLLVAGTATALSTRNDLEVILQASDHKEFFSKISIDNHPDIILFGVDTPPTDKIAILSQIKSALPEARIIALIHSVDTEGNLVSYLVNKDVNACINKMSSFEELYQAIIIVHYDEYYFNEILSKKILDGLKRNSAGELSYKSPTRLTERELEVLKLICEEKSTKEIASDTRLSPRTIEAIRQSLYGKLKVKPTVVGLVLYAIRHGLVLCA